MLVYHRMNCYNTAAFPPTCREAGDTVTPQRKAGQPFPLWKRVIYKYGQAVNKAGGKRPMEIVLALEILVIVIEIILIFLRH